MFTDVLPQQQIKLDTFMEWLQQWMRNEVYKQLQAFEQGNFNGMERTMRAQMVVMNQMYSFMQESVSSLRHLYSEEVIRVEDIECVPRRRDVE